MKIPLAWLQLSREKIRLLIALAGIGFADILMFMQLGFKSALLNSSVRLHEKIEGDVFLISPQSDALIAMKSFSSRRLYEALGVDGVESINPIYIGFSIWKNPENKNTRQIMVVGFNPKQGVFNLSGVTDNLDQLKLPDVVLFDQESRPEFGNIPQLYLQEKEVKTEIDSRQVKVGGLFTIGATFGADGNLITSDLNFLRLFPNRNKGLIDIGVIKLDKNANNTTVINSLKNKLNGGDVLILSREEFTNYEKNYWESSTAIGFIFTLGAGMGLVVGIVIVYQILYTDVADHLPEYATLKAMGYDNSYLLILVFQEAIFLACLGFIPGFGVSSFLYYQAAKATGLPIIMTKDLAILVFILTVIMCFLSGAIAVNKLKSADPADIF
ncbi:MAG: FtsX-like permease family protein [Cyanobacteria bacterium]|nr:FtsX-like permease family protein [Cyanobacteria bacterium CG_2015-16_32_12]NCO77273.1 FtsX-like permease family protein [Cyanobacteria bacterium CG_2015-22_32_23]NCQ05436.1 FtsX-like permease family protein [Cyanobacteria bacterium CG_2015-09_32_10]NCQ42641.1 FtsX-like permease family protein [Cyanobacteria bacterium CG_2015-04_32_10]NCS85097.1 FtsX-like permease family protein [Cyanobacteria bacterium CG_2015-02_32_10]